MSDTLFLIPLLIICIALFVLAVATSRRLALQIPSGKAIYQDTQAVGALLVSKKHRLKGRPDLLIKQGNVIIPVEVKTGKTPTRPYDSHVMQLVAYCVLVEENYGIRPPYGIIRYPSANFEVEFNFQREAELIAIMADITKRKHLMEVHRNHSNKMRCTSCGLNHACTERLDH